MTMAQQSKRRKTTKKSTKQSSSWQHQIKYEIIGLIMVLLSIVTLLKLGKAGEIFRSFFRGIVGELYLVAIGSMIVIGGFLIVKRTWPNFNTKKWVSFFIFVSALLLFVHTLLFETMTNQHKWEDHSVIRNTWRLFLEEMKTSDKEIYLGGGMLGAVLFACFNYLFAPLGTKIIAVSFSVFAIFLWGGKSFHEWLFVSFKQFVEQKKQQVKEWRNAHKQPEEDNTRPNKKKLKQNIKEPPNKEKEVEIADFTEHVLQEEQAKTDHLNKKEKQPKEETEQVTTVPFNGETENKDYQLPPIDLLTLNKPINQSKEKKQINKNVAILESTFQSFGVEATVTKVHLGPAVTKYEIHPEAGVKVSKIVNLSDDLALALAAKDLRIEAPIPGKSAVGIEVPNQEVAVVSLREVYDSPVKKKMSSKLSVALGRNISGEPVVWDLKKMPHLLVAGATGSGKSVCISGIILSILLNAKPHEVKMMMIDPKMVELSVYNGIPHLLTPVVTDPKKASQALHKIVQEMERRYELFSHSGTRNIEGYNDFIRKHNETDEKKQPFLPYIVVIVDELADLMMVASSDVEESITRLAQMARAAGIHLIIATQRPSVDVITGVIKANIPSRIAFSVSSMTDSRTILDMGGAEKLLGRGDMLFLPVGESKPVRIQGAFVSDEEVHKMVDYVISQQKAQYEASMMITETAQEETTVEDELYEEAVSLVLEMQTASVSMLQRRFRIGYARAARLIDAMELNGIVGPYEGSKPRKVLKERE